MNIIPPGHQPVVSFPFQLQPLPSYYLSSPSTPKPAAPGPPYLLPSLLRPLPKLHCCRVSLTVGELFPVTFPHFHLPPSVHPEVGGTLLTLPFTFTSFHAPRQNRSLSEARPRGSRRLPITLGSIPFRALFFKTDTFSPDPTTSDHDHANLWRFFPARPIVAWC